MGTKTQFSKSSNGIEMKTFFPMGYLLKLLCLQK